MEDDFYELEPEKFPTLDLTLYSEHALREMAYFIWSMYPNDAGLMEWRKQRLIPLLLIDDLVYSDDDAD